MYIIIEQQVNQEGADNITVIKSFNTVEDCNSFLMKLKETKESMAVKFDTKLLPNHYLFVYKFNRQSGIYTYQKYYRIFEV